MGMACSLDSRRGREGQRLSGALVHSSPISMTALVTICGGLSTESQEECVCMCIYIYVLYLYICLCVCVSLVCVCDCVCVCVCVCHSVCLSVCLLKKASPIHSADPCMCLHMTAHACVRVSVCGSVSGFNNVDVTFGQGSRKLRHGSDWIAQCHQIGFVIPRIRQEATRVFPKIVVFFRRQAG